MSPEPQGFHLPPPPVPSAAPPFSPVGGFGQAGGFGPAGGPPMYTPTPRPQRSGLAIAAMVCGIAGVFTFWLFGIPPILATIFGFVSAASIKKSNGLRTGLGMARTGWILGVLGIIGFGVFIWAAVTDRIGDNDDNASVLDLEIGDCLADLPSQGVVYEVELVDCNLPHAGEVFFTGELDPDRSRSFPGDSVVSDEAGASCLEQFEPFVGESYNLSVLDLQYLQPNEVGWKATRGGFTCVVFEPGKDVSSTLRNADR